MIFREFYDPIPSSSLPLYELDESCYAVEVLAPDRVLFREHSGGRLLLEWVTRKDPEELRRILAKVRRIAPDGFMVVAYREHGGEYKIAAYINTGPVVLPTYESMGPPAWLQEPQNVEMPEPRSTWERLLETETEDDVR
jgi:hypothetical protein